MPKAKAEAKHRRKARKARKRRQERPDTGDAGLQVLIDGLDGEAPWLARKRAEQARRAALQRQRLEDQRIGRAA